MQNIYKKILNLLSRFKGSEIPSMYSKFKPVYKPDSEISKLAEKNISPVINGNEVTFIYKGKVKRHIAVISETTHWSNLGFYLKKLRGKDIYHITIELPEDARLEYKYIIDNEWYLDPFNKNRCDNGIGGQNSYVTMPKYQRIWEIHKRKGKSYGNVQLFEMEGKAIPGIRRVYVYTPPGYNENSDNYPVIYIQDGQEYFERCRVDNIADNLIQDKKIQPLIMVMINPIDRGFEYIMNPYYTDLVIKEIIPRVDKRFRTIATPDGRGIIGASLGGLISVYVALTHPDIFSKAGSQSGAFIHVQYQMEELIERIPLQPVSFYLDAGRFEDSLIQSNHRIIKLLEQKSV